MDDPEMGLGKDGARTRTWMSPGAGGGGRRDSVPGTGGKEPVG